MDLPPASIGTLRLRSAVLMAPMVGLTTRAYRLLALRHDCALAAAEMIACEHLVRSTPEQRARYILTDADHPTALQIVGARPEAMAASARMLEDLGADVIDLNMGCPVRRITSGGGGAALGRNSTLAARVTDAVRGAVGVPVTVKVRDFSSGREGALADLGRALEEAGADAITVHARPASARHRGTPRLGAVAEMVGAVSVPVFGNGGIREPGDALRMVRESGCAGVMIGRAAIGDVSIYSRTARLLHEGRESPVPDGETRLAQLETHLDLLVEEFGEEDAVIRFRKCLPHLLRGVRGARQGRLRITHAPTPESVIEIARSVLLAQRTSRPRTR